MAGFTIGRWRFVRPNLHWARLEVAGAKKDRVILLKIAAGFAAPAHGHGGPEPTQFLGGSFADGRAHDGRGDMIEVDMSLDDHLPPLKGRGEWTRCSVPCFSG